MKGIVFIFLIILLGGIASAQEQNKDPRQTDVKKSEPLLIHKCLDFTVTGKGNNPEWDKAAWAPLQKLDEGGSADESHFKILYSTTGVYVFLTGADSKITTTFEKDFDDLYLADVFEVFMQPDPQLPLYLEYEVNALEKELVLLIPNVKGKITGWTPWHYEGGRKVVKKISVTGGSAVPGGAISSWSAELYFPFALFNPLSNVPPHSGTIWNANFFRLDYDSGKMIKFAWSPVEKSFHEFWKFRPIRFE